MLGACALLLWVILAIGRHLTPPENIGGTWLPDAGTVGPGPMRVEQSGHFFQIGFEDGHRADVKLTQLNRMGNDVTMKMEGGTWHFDVSGKLSTNGLLSAMHWVVDGPTKGDWNAHRADEHPAGKGGEK